MSKKIKEMAEKGVPIEELGEIMGLDRIRITRAKRVFNLKDGYKTTEKELKRLIEKIYRKKLYGG